MYTLDIQGKFDKGKKYAEMMPPYEICRENLMQYMVEDDMEKLEFDQSFAQTLFRDLVRYLKCHAGWLKDKTYTLEERLRLCTMVRTLVKAYFPDGDYPWWGYGDLFESYLNESGIYVEMDRPDEAADSLRKAVDIVEWEKETAGAEQQHTAPFMTTFTLKRGINGTWWRSRMKYFLRHTGRDDSGIVLYFRNEKAKAFAETPGYREQIARFEALCGK